MQILVVEDELGTRRAVSRSLELIGYGVDEAASGSEALVKLATAPYDLMLLDLHLPEVDGVEVMKQARETRPELLVIILTGYGTFESAVSAVKAGATDYLIKPCRNREIEAAVARAFSHRREQLQRGYLVRTIVEAARALQDKGNAPRPFDLEERFLRCGPVTLDQNENLATTVWVDGAATRRRSSGLTPRETALMAHFMRHPDVTFSCHELARVVFGYDVSKEEAQKIVRPHISRLRRKLGLDPTGPSLIYTVRGQGYFFSPR
jgi:DNA-binding response OmpR family regulator